MTLRVIGAGVGRTGTASLKEALEKLLDGPCHHMAEVFTHPEQMQTWTDAIEGRATDWAEIMDGYVAQVDWPGASFWPELLESNPDALVILSVRDPQAWYTSASNTIFQVLGRSDEEIGLLWAGTAPSGWGAWMVAMKRLLLERFCDDFGQRDAMVAAFERHNDDVRRRVSSAQLLEWSAEQGWGPICARLGVPVPREPFPVTNTTDEFRANVLQPLANGTASAT
jgi:hypothetical protein